MGVEVAESSNKLIILLSKSLLIWKIWSPTMFKSTLFIRLIILRNLLQLQILIFMLSDLNNNRIQLLREGIPELVEVEKDQLTDRELGRRQSVQLDIENLLKK